LGGKKSIEGRGERFWKSAELAWVLLVVWRQLSGEEDRMQKREKDLERRREFECAYKRLEGRAQRGKRRRLKKKAGVSAPISCQSSKMLLRYFLMELYERENLKRRKEGYI